MLTWDPIQTHNLTFLLDHNSLRLVFLIHKPPQPFTKNGYLEVQGSTKVCFLAWAATDGETPTNFPMNFRWPENVPATATPVTTAPLQAEKAERPETSPNWPKSPLTGRRSEKTG